MRVWARMGLIYQNASVQPEPDTQGFLEKTGYGQIGPGDQTAEGLTILDRVSPGDGRRLLAAFRTPFHSARIFEF